MSYTVRNFKTKKEVKEAVTNYWKFVACIQDGKDKKTAVTELSLDREPIAIRCYNPGIGPDLSSFTGSVILEGPHAPAPHRWYAQGEMKDGILVSVK